MLVTWQTNLKDLGVKFKLVAIINTLVSLSLLMRLNV